MARVAAVFSGPVSRIVPDSGESIRRHLVRPLQADVLLALSYKASDGCATAETCGVRRRLAALQPFARVDLERQLTLDELVGMMERLPHWPAIVRAYNSPRKGLACARNSSWRREADRGSPYNCTGILHGNSIFAPVIGATSLQTLPMLRGVQHCLETVRAHEAAAGWRFGRIVFSRLEFWWLRPHPPLELLAPEAVWAPTGEDYYGGVNDRHAVLNRSAAEVYLGRWRALQHGQSGRLGGAMAGHQQLIRLHSKAWGCPPHS